LLVWDSMKHKARQNQRNWMAIALILLVALALIAFLLAWIGGERALTRINTPIENPALPNQSPKT
jgi:hypothetical protein